MILDPPAPYQDQFLEFRDPNVFWHQGTERWVAVISLAKLHKLLIYTSNDLKKWDLASEFGPANAVGGVWECPSIFPLPLDGGESEKWVLMLGLNPGGPPGTVGSGTQYIVGSFNGTAFTADSDSIYDGSGATEQVANWLDWGPDFYAALGWNGLPTAERTVIAWMNNWQYGATIPTDPWRSAMTVPRRLALKTVGGKATLVQEPAGEWKGITPGGNASTFPRVDGVRELGRIGKTIEIDLTFSNRQPLSSGNSSEFGIVVAATQDYTQQTRVGYNFGTQEVFIDRSQSGDVSFDGTFASTYSAPLSPSANGTVSLRVYVDWSSVEVFGGQGEATITSQIFPSTDAVYGRLFSSGGATNNVKLGVKELRSTWR